MTEEEAFLQAIIDDPDNDAPRLIYADWLEERGRSERAELIRVQCETARMEATWDWDNSRYERLSERAAHLQYGPGREWHGTPPLPGSFQRGFVETIHATGKEFIEGATSWFQRSPIREAWLKEVKHCRRRLFDAPQLARLETLRMSFMTEDAPLTGVVRSLAACPYLTGLKHIDLPGNMLGDADVRTLANSPHLPSLTVLELNLNGIGPAGVRALAESPLGPQLTRLDLESNPLTADGLRELLTSPGLGRLTSLKLGGHEIGPMLAEVLPSLTPEARLTELTLGGFGLRESGLPELAASSVLRGLKKLDLCGDLLDVSQLRELLASPQLSSLEELDLSVNRLGYAGARILAEWPGLRRLKSLNLASTGIREAGVQALANSPYVTPSLRLGISGKRRTKKESATLREALGDSIRLWFIED